MFPISTPGQARYTGVQPTQASGNPESLSDEEAQVLDILANMPHGEQPDPPAQHAQSAADPLQPGWNRDMVTVLKNSLGALRDQRISEALQLEALRVQVENIETALDAPPPQAVLLPLHSAVIANDCSLLRQLLESNENNINATDSDGRTAQMTAAIYDRLHCFLALTRHGANTRMRDRNGDSLIDLAAAHSLPIFKLLYAFGHSPNTPTERMEPLLESFREITLAFRQSPTEEVRSQIKALSSGLIKYCLFGA